MIKQLITLMPFNTYHALGYSIPSGQHILIVGKVEFGNGNLELKLKYRQICIFNQHDTVTYISLDNGMRQRSSIANHKDKLGPWKESLE